MIQYDNNLAIFDGPHYSMNKKLLSLFGLWPALGRTRKIISVVIVTLVIMSLYVPMLAGLLYYRQQKIWLNVLENFAALIYLNVFFCKYFSSYLFEDRIKLIYEQIASDWRTVTDDDEIKILTRYSETARLLTFIYVVYVGFGEIVFYGFPFFTIMMDKIMPLENETRVRVKPYHPYYCELIDADKYYYHMYFAHGSVVGALGTITIISIDTMFASNIQHACALFAIVRYRLSKIGTLENEREYESRVVDDKQVYESIVHVCDMHRTSMKSVDLIWNSFSFSFLVFMGSCILVIAIIMFDFIFNLTHPIEKMMAIVIWMGINTLLFYMSWIAQQLSDSSENVFIAVCSNRWYNLSIKGQKMIYFLLQNNLKKITLRAGGIVELNLQQFAAILKTAMSYATVMMSMNG